MKKNKICIICKSTFKYRSNKIYCSKKCKCSSRKRPHLKYRKTVCEECGFIPIHICQLDVDHINSNHKDNKINNLKTLCANCHRLKTMIERNNHEKFSHTYLGLWSSR